MVSKGLNKTESSSVGFYMLKITNIIQFLLFHIYTGCTVSHICSFLLCVVGVD